MQRVFGADAAEVFEEPDGRNHAANARVHVATYQMIGRGTRIDDDSGKLMFTVYDYTGATRLFAEDFITERRSEREETDGPSPETGPGPFVNLPPPPAPVLVDGLKALGAAGEPKALLRETKERMFAA